MDYKKLYTKYKTLYFNQKNKLGGNKKKIKINIVDEHHHVLNHILKNNKKKEILNCYILIHIPIWV